MPEWTKVLLALLPAIGVALFVRAIVRRRIRDAQALVRAEAEAARVALATKLEAREAELATLRGELGAERSRTETLRSEVGTLQARGAELSTRLEEEREQMAEKQALLDAAQQKLADAFRGLASEALSHNNRMFLDLAQERLEAARKEASGELEQRRQAIESLVAPMREQLTLYEKGLRELESSRKEAYGQLGQQLASLSESQQGLVRETGRLVTALRRPEVRGNWGEVQLKRAVEFAGMVDRVDFLTQESVAGEEGRLRPDMVVRLPGEKSVVVDSKAPLDAFLSAVEATNEEERRAHLARHARQVRTHLTKLSEKRYWDQFDDAPEFVVLFLPGEAFFAAALEEDPTLIEDAFRQSVLITTPATLVALLKTVAYGWRQETLAANAREISDVARELYDRVRVFAEHLDRVGKGLEDAVKAHNAATRSFSSRVLPQGRRLESLEAAPDKRLEEPRAVELAPLPSGAQNDAES